MSNLLTTRELAARLRLSPSTIRGWARDGRIPVQRMSRRALRYDLEQVLAELRSSATSAVTSAKSGRKGGVT